MSQLDFQQVSSELLSRALPLLESWFPAGKLRGSEFQVGSLDGEPGGSLSINIKTGKWADFATGEKGGDLIALYAKIHNINNLEAARRLSGADAPTSTLRRKVETQPTTSLELDLPPENITPPQNGASQMWCYRSVEGKPIFYVARYDGSNGKTFKPYSWDKKSQKWVNKSWPAPRPLYNLDKIQAASRCLLCEGEKSADAAAQIAGSHYAVTTWPNGAASWKKTDWTPLYGKHVLIWPDADEPGIKCARQIAAFLVEHGCQVKIIAVDENLKGWDAADALSEGWTWKEFLSWAKPRASEFTGDDGPTPLTKMQQNVSFVAPEPSGPEVMPEPPAYITTAEEQPPATESQVSHWRSLGLIQQSNGQPIANIINVYRILQSMSGNGRGDLVWYDEFHRKYLTLDGNNEPREWSDSDDLKLTGILQSQYGLARISVDTVNQGMQLYANEVCKNEVKDWLESLKWDGKRRLEEFFCDCLGADLSEYTITASKNFWISIVARAYDPGCKVDNMVILEGDQGRYKSTALRAIGGKWFCEANERVDSKDFYLVLQGKLLVEISELDAFSKAESSSIKRAITCQVDRFRVPYGRATQDFPRQCIFVGTTNEHTYLSDSTGGRRFWPVRTGVIAPINIDWIKEQREQLFAEAVHRYKANETWYEMPHEETSMVQEERRTFDSWEDIIATWLETPEANNGSIITTTDVIADKALGLAGKELTPGIERRLHRILRLLGYKSGNKKIHGQQVRCWQPIK